MRLLALVLRGLLRIRCPSLPENVHWLARSGRNSRCPGTTRSEHDVTTQKRARANEPYSVQSCAALTSDILESRLGFGNDRSRCGMREACLETGVRVATSRVFSVAAGARTTVANKVYALYLDVASIVSPRECILVVETSLKSTSRWRRGMVAHRLWKVAN